jgi:S-adenosyl-l-methionine hydroxide adenosyltransferase
MIVLFTDFGLHGPYTGQMKAVLHQMAPGIPSIDLFADAPVALPSRSARFSASTKRANIGCGELRSLRLRGAIETC